MLDLKNKSKTIELFAGAGSQYSEHKKAIFELVPPGGYRRDIPEGVAKPYMKSLLK